MANFAGINAAQGTIRLPNGTQVALSEWHHTDRWSRVYLQHRTHPRAFSYIAGQPVPGAATRADITDTNMHLSGAMAPTEAFLIDGVRVDIAVEADVDADIDTALHSVTLELVVSSRPMFTARLLHVLDVRRFPVPIHIGGSERFAVAFSHDLPPGMNVDVMTTLSGQHKRVCR